MKLSSAELVTAARVRWRRSIKPRRALLFGRCFLPLHRGTTIVIVNWNSLQFLRHTVGAVQRFSPPTTRILVVDNGSADGSLDWLVRQDLRVFDVGRNIGHGPALDLGFTAVRTRTVVALDVDAFPISNHWLERLDALLTSGAHVAGAEGGAVLDRLTVAVPEGWGGRQPFVHPCCLAMRLRRFAWRRHSFHRDRTARKDPGERISDRERPRLGLIPPSSSLGPGPVGTVFGEIVYHNFYGTRHQRQGTPTVDGVSAVDAAAAWDRALATYLAGGSS